MFKTSECYNMLTVIKKKDLGILGQGITASSRSQNITQEQMKTKSSKQNCIRKKKILIHYRILS